MMLLEHQDIIAKFFDPSHWKELSKESCSKILPCGDGSCWEAFKTIASLIAKGELKLMLARSFPIFTIKVKKITATALRFNRDAIVKENILDNGLETVTPSLAAKNIILRNVGVESAKRHKENSNIIKEIRASTDAAIRNQGFTIIDGDDVTKDIALGMKFCKKDEGKSHAETLVDIPVFIRSFSIITGFTIIDGDDVTKDIALGMKFCKKYASCQMIMKKFSLGDKYERINDE
nr:hypothetical protein [Tanacetum cinerariifolium]